MKETVGLFGRQVGPGHPALTIAEAGINHNGDVEIAKRLVAAAAAAGADAVKFQTLTAETLMTESSGASAHLEAGAGREDVYSFVRRISLSREAHQEIWRACEAAGISFLSSVFSPESLALLESLGVAAYKVASMDLDNLPLLREIARTGKPIILSTGMGTMSEVDRALAAIDAANGTEVVLLHCTSQYPTSARDANLRAMDSMRQAFGVPVGFSDHTMGNTVALAAVARGANAVEKHFTLDRTMPGPDQALSAEPAEFEALVSGIREVEAALGGGRKQPVAGELEMRQAFRRSIVAAVDIPEGAVLTAEMLTFKRPGSGISPADLDWVVGRTARCAIPADTVVQRDQLR